MILLYPKREYAQRAFDGLYAVWLSHPEWEDVPSLWECIAVVESQDEAMEVVKAR